MGVSNLSSGTVYKEIAGKGFLSFPDISEHKDRRASMVMASSIIFNNLTMSLPKKGNMWRIVSSFGEEEEEELLALGDI